MKICKANTPLILTDAAGAEYRVEAGETVRLSAAQYEAVAAHVAVLETEETPEPETQEQEESETPSETAGGGEEKPAKTRKAKAE